jgi:hypothetical protein
MRGTFLSHGGGELHIRSLALPPCFRSGSVRPVAEVRVQVYFLQAGNGRSSGLLSIAHAAASED